MELKKSPKADLESRRSLFLEIGLALSLALVILMFSWSQEEQVVEKIDMGLTAPEQEIIEVTTQEEKPVVPQKQTIQVLSDFINVVKNETKITTEISFEDFSEDVVIAPPAAAVVEEVVEDDAPVMIVEDMPSFQGGGIEVFRNWVMERLRYPQVAQENNIQGKVVLSFVIERDGSLSSIEILQSPDKSLADEASRVLAMSPKWKPGKQRNLAVRVKFVLPVEFKLQH